MVLNYIIQGNMYIAYRVIDNIMKTIGTLEAECGGIIAISKGEISDYYFDSEAGYGKASYVPSRGTIQNYIREKWSTPELRFCGIVHSHPYCNTCEPSHIDIDMALKIMSLNNMDKLYLIIVKGDEIKLFCVSDSQNEGQKKYCEEKIEVPVFRMKIIKTCGECPRYESDAFGKAYCHLYKKDVSSSTKSCPGIGTRHSSEIYEIEHLSELPVDDNIMKHI